MAGLVTIPDSYFNIISNRMTALGATVVVNGQTISQPLGAVLHARDWPQTPPVEGAPYLLVLGINAVGGSEAQIKYEVLLQWTWLLIGADINGNITANRGDRYRSNMAIMSNLRQANYPQWTQKMDFAFNSQTGVGTTTPVTSTIPYSAYESIWWTPLKFFGKSDDKSGLLYGTASLTVYGYDDVLASIA